MNSLVEVQGVDQTFRVGFWMKRRQVLENINLSIPRGSIFGFLGANGAGKTTLIHLIVGLRRPVQGTVRVYGKDATDPQAKLRLGYLPERPYFYDHLTAEGVLFYFGALSGMKHEEIRARIPIVLDQVGMRDAQKLELRRYSKGMLQRIGIAQALIHDPDFLVLDEPMSGLDPIGRKEVRELILSLAAEGRTIFFSTHIIPDVEAICDQVALIRKGKLIKSGSIADLLSTRKSEVEIIWRGPSLGTVLDWPALSKLDTTPAGFRGIVQDERNVNSVLSELIQKGALISSVSPMRNSLEDFFRDEKDQAGPQEGIKQSENS